MTDPELPLNNRNLIRQVLVAWVVAVWAVAIGAFLLVFHEPRPDDRMVPRWHKPPVAGAEEWDENLSVRHGAGWALPQSGSSSAPDASPERQ